MKRFKPLIIILFALTPFLPGDSRYIEISNIYIGDITLFQLNTDE